MVPLGYKQAALPYNNTRSSNLKGRVLLFE